MTSKEVVEQLNAVLHALNNVTVCGKQNMTNLIGSIQVLESISTQLGTAENSLPRETQVINK